MEPSVDMGVAPRILAVLAAGILLFLAERVIPARPAPAVGRRLWPNVGYWILTFTTFGALAYFLTTQVFLLTNGGLNLFGAIGITSPVAIVVISFIALDFSIYVAHVLMHKIPWFWRAHQFHHSDVFVDATTGLRQHPFESLIRYSFQMLPALLLGIPPIVVAAYALVNGVWAPIEHTNMALPEKVNRLLQYVLITPNAHKIHHHDGREMTDTNYGNILSIWDRMFGTYTQQVPVEALVYGLEDKRRLGFFGGLISPFTYLAPIEACPGVASVEPPSHLRAARETA